MTASLFENGVLVESDKTAAFEYDHGRASGSSLSLFHVSNLEAGKIVNYKISATNENISKVTYSCVGV